MHSRGIGGRSGRWLARVLPAAGWRGLSGGGGVRGRGVRGGDGSVHGVGAPLPVPCRRGLLPAPALLGPGRVRRAAGLAAGVHRRAHDVPVSGGRRVRGREGRGVRAQDRPGAAGSADRGGQGPVRPRGDRGRPTGRGRGPALRRRARRRLGVRDGPHRGRGRPGRCPGPGGRGLRRRPGAQRSGFDRVSRRTPRDRRGQPRPRPADPRARLRTQRAVRPASPTGGAARPPRASRCPRRRRTRPGPARPVARSPPSRSGTGAATPTPRSRSSRSWTSPSTSRSAPTGQRPAQAPDPAPRPHLRLPVLLPPRREVRLRTPRRRHTATADPPAPATSHLVAGATTAPRPPAAGATSPSNPASTCGAARWATSSSATTPAPSTSPPTPNDCRLARTLTTHFGPADPTDPADPEP